MQRRTLLFRVSLAVLVMAVALAAVFRMISHPVEGKTYSYTAIFTDVNGLRSGDDVRLYGVQVGKVSDMSLDGTRARVHFTVTRSHPLFNNTRIAIRYQNLAGFRYLDIQQPDTPAGRRDPGKTFATSETVPSFDITTLFKGLQPVLAELSPDDLNQFTSSMLAVIEGDGTGFGPALGAIEKLSNHVRDRQALLSTLVSNLALISDHMGGKSASAMKLLTNLTNLFTAITDKLPGLVDFSYTIPPVLQPIRNILNLMGVTGDRNKDLDAALQRALPDPHEAVDVLGRLPGLIQSLTATLPPTGADAKMTCTNGVAVAPQPLQLLIAGQEVTLCRR